MVLGQAFLLAAALLLFIGAVHPINEFQTQGFAELTALRFEVEAGDPRLLGIEVVDLLRDG